MKRSVFGFTLIELMIVVAIIAVITAVAIPNLLRSKMAANEAATIAAMHTFASGQAVYLRSQGTYAFPWDRLNNLTLGGEKAQLIDNAFAMASGPVRGRAGYWFADIETSRTGEPYVYEFDFGLTAAPCRFNASGLNTFIIDVQGTVYQRSIAGDQVTTFPSDPGAVGWMLPE